MWIRIKEPDDTGDSAVNRDAQDGSESWVQFGRQRILYTGDERPPADADTAAWRQAPGAPQGLHVVIQHGRRFQQHHPSVPVVHDRGRFLLVRLDPADASRLTSPGETCFDILPVTPGMVVFEERARRAGLRRDARIDDVLERLASDQVRTTLEHLAGFPTRHSTSPGFLAAAAFATDRLRALGYDVTSTPVPVRSGQSLNVIAEKTGSGPSPRRVVAVTAHLDSINASGAPSVIAPGADDNASGSAGLLEMARVLASETCRDDLRFVLFGGEEQGLLGSQLHVQQMNQTERERLTAVVNMDMIGRRNTTVRSVLLEGAPVSEATIDGLADAAAVYTSLQVETSRHAANSDHVPFIRAGVPAVLTIEGADNTNDRVHTSGDTADTIDHDLLREVLRMNVAFVLNVAGHTV